MAHCIAQERGKMGVAFFPIIGVGVCKMFPYCASDPGTISLLFQSSQYGQVELSFHQPCYTKLACTQ